MSTLPIRALHGLAFPDFGHIASFTGAVLDVLSEALRLRRDAQKRYPFAEW